MCETRRSIGIENEGTFTSVTPPAALYSALVDSCAYICQQYRIPATAIYGHRDLMSTACPGDVLYAELPQLRRDVAAELTVAVAAGRTRRPWTTRRRGGSGRAVRWATSSWSSQKYSANYRYANPRPVSDGAWYKFKISSAGTYRVDVWYAANAGYNAAAPVAIITTGGTRTVRIDQRSGGGRWRSLGNFSLSAGDKEYVAISRWSSSPGYVIADAVRVTKV